ncbi:MAG: Rv3235 family protein [Micrococcus sp.]|nr:Rv3235 family protein [Micrococcus sp.]
MSIPHPPPAALQASTTPAQDPSSTLAPQETAMTLLTSTLRPTAPVSASVLLTQPRVVTPQSSMSAEPLAAPAQRATTPARGGQPSATTADALAARARAEIEREDLRTLRTLVASVAVACVDVEHGRRHLRDLTRWLDLRVYDKVARRLDLLRRSGAAMDSAVPARPLGTRVCEVADGIVEASTTVVSGGRARAVALRCERRLSRWRVVALEMG